MFEDFRLKVFLTAAREGSFTLAARKLGVSQPAVSQNIGEIEKGFGVQLFERRRGSVALTPQGEVFKAYAENILGSYNELEAIFNDFDAISSIKVIRIAVSRDLLAEISATLLPYIYTLNPKVAVAIMLAPVSGADVTITENGTSREVVPTREFEDHPIWPLLRVRLEK